MLYMLIHDAIFNGQRQFLGCKTRDFGFKFSMKLSKNHYKQHFTNLNDHTMKSLILDAQCVWFLLKREKNPIQGLFSLTLGS